MNFKTEHQSKDAIVQRREEETTGGNGIGRAQERSVLKKKNLRSEDHF